LLPGRFTLRLLLLTHHLSLVLRRWHGLAYARTLHSPRGHPMEALRHE